MPRLSKRIVHLKNNDKVLLQRKKMARLRFLLDSSDDLEDDLDMIATIKSKKDSSSRYLYRPPNYKHRFELRNDLVDKRLHSNEYNETEFLEHFRVRKEFFWALHEKIKDDEMFNKVRGTKEKTSSELHLLVLLKFLGSNGNEATPSKLGQYFQMSKGCFMEILK